MAFSIIRNDITKVKADAIVNTANPKPIYGGGTDSAVYHAAGMEQLLAERQKIGSIARGQVAVTPAFNLKAKYIIHTVGPVWEGGNKGEFEILRQCYENSLNLALELGCKSIAFPLIATGVYGFPKDKALQIAMSVIQAFLMEHSMKVIMVVFNKDAFELSGQVVENVREYVDANYVEEATKREYNFGSRRRSRFIDEEMVCLSACMPREDLSETDSAQAHASKISSRSMPKPSSIENVDWEELLASSDKTFQEKLFEIIDERQMAGPEVYKGYVSKQVYSKMQADKYYHPTKYTAVALCLSLHLDLAETEDLIGRAGWRLSQSSKTDLVVRACIINHEYSVININTILFELNCPLLEAIK